MSTHILQHLHCHFIIVQKVDWTLIIVLKEQEIINNRITSLVKQCNLITVNYWCCLMTGTVTYNMLMRLIKSFAVVANLFVAHLFLALQFLPGSYSLES